MKGLLALLATVAVASCTPTVGIPSVLDGKGGGGHGGGAGGVLGHGVNVPGAIVGGVLGGVPGAIIGSAVKKPVSIPGAIVGGAVGGPPGAVVGGLLGGAVGAGGGGGHSGSSGGLVSGILGGARPKGRTDRGYKQKGGVYPVGGGGLFQALGFLAQGLTDIAGNAGSILEDVVHLRIPAVLDDGLNAVISTGRGLGGIINALIPGHGSLLGNLVVAIGKLAICLLGSPGLTGSLLGRTPGQDNPKDIPYICTPDYGRDWGCSYDGPYDKPDSIIKYYKLRNSTKQAHEHIDKYTKGQGIGSLTGSRKIVVTSILVIADIFDKGSNWDDDDIIKITINIIIINGVLGDSYQPGLGNQIVDEWITILKKHNKNKRLPDLTKYKVQILAALKGDNEDNWGGSFNPERRSGWSKIKHNIQNDDDCDSNDENNQSDNDENNTNNSDSNGDDCEESNNDNGSNTGRNEPSSSSERSRRSGTNNGDDCEESNNNNESTAGRNEPSSSSKSSQRPRTNNGDDCEESNNNNESTAGRNEPSSSSKRSQRPRTNNGDDCEESNNNNGSNARRNEPSSSSASSRRSRANNGNTDNGTSGQKVHY